MRTDTFPAAPVLPGRSPPPLHPALEQELANLIEGHKRLEEYRLLMPSWKRGRLHRGKQLGQLEGALSQLEKENPDSAAIPALRAECELWRDLFFKRGSPGRPRRRGLRLLLMAVIVARSGVTAADAAWHMHKLCGEDSRNALVTAWSRAGPRARDLGLTRLRAYPTPLLTSEDLAALRDGTIIARRARELEAMFHFFNRQ